MANNAPTSTASLCAATAHFTKGQTVAAIYRLERPLGHDAAFTRWLAHDEQLDASVVLHFLPDAVAGDGRALTELRQEVKRNRQLVHPHVVRVHDLVEEENWAALATDHVEGDSLAVRLAAKNGGAFDPAEILPWIEQLCRSLEDAHRIGLLHRDLRPENLVVTKSGELMVSSFGVSRTILDALVRARIPIPPGSDIAYASPQQLDGERPTRADDIYSLGATLYDLLSGRPPFHTGDLVPQVRKITPPPVSERRAELKVVGAKIPKSWDAVIAACLDKPIETRPQSAEAVGAQLAAARGEIKPAVTKPGSSSVLAPPQKESALAPVPAPAKKVEVQAEKSEPAKSGPAKKTAPPARSAFAPALNPADDAGAKGPPYGLIAALLLLVLGVGAFLFFRPTSSPVRGTANSTPAPALAVPVPEDAGKPAVSPAMEFDLERPTPIPESELPVEEATPVVPEMPEPQRAVAAAKEKADAAALVLEQRAKKQAETASAVAAAAAELAKAREAAAAAKKDIEKLTVEQTARQAAQEKAAAAAAEAKKAAEEKERLAQEAASAVEENAKAAAERTAAAEEAAKAITALEADLAAQKQVAAEAETNAAAAAKIQEQEALAFKQAQDASEKAAAEAEAARAAEAARIGEEKRLAQERENARLTAQAEAAQKAAAEAQRLADEAKQAMEQLDLLRQQGIEAQKKADEARRRAEEAAEAIKTGVPLPTPIPAVSPSAKAENSQLENSLGMRFAPVGGVLFSIWHTRVQDFEAFVKASGSTASAWKSPGFQQGPDHPVVNVSWYDALAFCKWLTTEEHKSGSLAAGRAYRLPTDVEWSAAVGLPPEEGATPYERDLVESKTYPWGTQWPPPPNVANYSGEETGLDAALPGYNDGYSWTSPVGSFSPNSLGLYDMGGNASQWVMDWWSSKKKEKVLRGGSWFQGAIKMSLLASSRTHVAPEKNTDSYGFRVVIADDRGENAAL